MTGRFEYKYELDGSQVAAVRAFAGAYCVPDPLGDCGRYEVDSLYFDTWDSRLAEHTIQGHHTRHKVRLRTYGFSQEGSLFAEIKRRSGGRVHKERALVDRAWAVRLIERRSAAEPAIPEQASVFRATVDRDDLRPRVWVRYVREAFVSPYGDPTRLTIDSDISAQPVSSSDHALHPHPARWVPVSTSGRVVLELKFSDTFPAWMRRLAHAGALPRSRYSKYVRSIVAVGAPLRLGVPWTVS